MARFAIGDVVRGTKSHAKGKLGLVLGVHDGRYGTKLTVRYVDGSRVDATAEIYARSDDDPTELLEAVAAAEAAEKAQKDADAARLAEHVARMPPLTGSPKQVAWANTIRLRATDNGWPDDQVASRTEASWWIANQRTASSRYEP